eukprot:TRINITY_DN75490_c0_g1_i1.p1 TRINITY_DN75490_c0_g1~~TRINITY_DN75490_c0_g1_i1.p1  ORF type:complete len:389 (-),score=55.71 TRINITY_DN75490_c0_g1_i1:83-1249(-)
MVQRSHGSRQLPRRVLPLVVASCCAAVYSARVFLLGRCRQTGRSLTRVDASRVPGKWLSAGRPGLALRGTALRAVEASDEDPTDWFTLESSVDILGATPLDAYHVYSHLPNHVLWSSWLSEVHTENAVNSQWSIKGWGFTLSWHSRIVADIPSERLEWKSTSGHPNRGRATFEELPSDLSGCRVRVQMSFRNPRFLKSVLPTRRLQRLLEPSVTKDLSKFKDVVLEMKQNMSTSVTEGARRLYNVPLVNTTRSDNMGSCSAVLWRDGRVEFRMRGFGTANNTQAMLADVSAGIAQLAPEVECRAFCDMTQGLGCSPMAFSPIVRFLRSDGKMFKQNGVLGPRIMMKIAQFLAMLANITDVKFFADAPEAEDWFATPWPEPEPIFEKEE